jgi:hypothetical protein
LRGAVQRAISPSTGNRTSLLSSSILQPSHYTELRRLITTLLKLIMCNIMACIMPSHHFLRCERTYSSYVKLMSELGNEVGRLHRRCPVSEWIGCTGGVRFRSVYCEFALRLSNALFFFYNPSLFAICTISKWEETETNGEEESSVTLIHT